MKKKVIFILNKEEFEIQKLAIYNDIINIYSIVFNIKMENNLKIGIKENDLKSKNNIETNNQIKEI